MGNAPSTPSVVYQPTDTSQITQNLNALISQVNVMQNNMDSQSQTINKLTNQMNNQSQTVATISNNVAALVNQLNNEPDYSNVIAKLNANQSATTSALNTLTSQVDSTSSSLSSLYKNQQDIVQELSTIPAPDQIQDLLSRIGQAEINVSSLAKNVGALSTYVNTLPTPQNMAAEFDQIDAALAALAANSSIGVYYATLANDVAQDLGVKYYFNNKHPEV